MSLRIQRTVIGLVLAASAFGIAALLGTSTPKGKNSWSATYMLPRHEWGFGAVKRADVQIPLPPIREGQTYRILRREPGGIVSSDGVLIVREHGWSSPVGAVDGAHGPKPRKPAQVTVVYDALKAPFITWSTVPKPNHGNRVALTFQGRRTKLGMLATDSVTGVEILR